MSKICRDLDLSQKPLGAERGGQLAPQHLDGNLALVLQVVSEVYDRHAAAADFALDGVARGEGGSQVI